MLDRLTIVNIENVVKTWIEIWNGKIPQWLSELRIWGEEEVVKTKKLKKPKMKRCGVTCMLFGYVINHSDSVYMMWNAKTN